MASQQTILCLHTNLRSQSWATELTSLTSYWWEQIVTIIIKRQYKASPILHLFIKINLWLLPQFCWRQPVFMKKSPNSYMGKWEILILISSDERYNRKWKISYSGNPPTARRAGLGKNNKKLHFAFLEEKKWIQSRFLNGSLDRKPSLQGLCLFFSPLDDPFGVVSSA